jgi:hypothetical protein
MNQIHSRNVSVPCSLHWPYMLKTVHTQGDFFQGKSGGKSMHVWFSLKTYKSAVEPARKLQPLDILLQDIDM